MERVTKPSKATRFNANTYVEEAPSRCHIGSRSRLDYKTTRQTTYSIRLDSMRNSVKLDNNNSKVSQVPLHWYALMRKTYGTPWTRLPQSRRFTPFRSSPSSAAETHEGVRDHVAQGELPPPRSKKKSLVDLTGKKAPRLDNEGYSTGGSTSSLESRFLSFENIIILPSFNQDAGKPKSAKFLTFVPD
ncbi:hypothetical protein P175DRAFT_0561122 [Aspergillus ochraceoroseus IBT 24754]|uniref:Uncharacterized protein n=1 Tax=Aspergillus ochraceoroseus IBT 24754 TaxID=1392256 RepID=A0A2T5LLC0_9EURO|nr:uncharacterized protein P175DRAFT_0561122 [Aspergillus ochraceoroseus IBT 24754]PTU17069.1 hypothetical protein P175DRAFT_0561122 [Aspergillus ochraceoroseus IBT 24754]